MILNFVTHFDRLFIPQGLALYFSMKKNIKDFRLWIVCIDDEVFDFFKLCQFEEIYALKLSDFEDEELLNIKNNRTKGEYCWTLTPQTIRMVFESDLSVKQVTYIDADIWFRRSPKEIFDEFDSSGKSVLITDHAYFFDHDHSPKSGRFCVQFMIFNRDINGLKVQKWWELKCLDWCFARYENGKFGDQMYLDIWPDIFEKEVHILKAEELTLAPWNFKRFPFGKSVFFHFHQLKIIDENTVFTGEYVIPSNVLKYVYKEYFLDLRRSINLIKNHGFKIYFFKGNYRLMSINFIIKRVLKKILGFVKFNYIHKI